MKGVYKSVDDVLIEAEDKSNLVGRVEGVLVGLRTHDLISSNKKNLYGEDSWLWPVCGQIG